MNATSIGSLATGLVMDRPRPRSGHGHRHRPHRASTQRPAWRLHWREPTMNTMLVPRPAWPRSCSSPWEPCFSFGRTRNRYRRTAPQRPSPSPAGSPSRGRIAIGGPDARSRRRPSRSSRPYPSRRLPAGTVRDGDRAFLRGSRHASGANGTIGVMTGPFARFDDRDCEDRAPCRRWDVRCRGRRNSRCRPAHRRDGSTGGDRRRPDRPDARHAARPGLDGHVRVERRKAGAR